MDDDSRMIAALERRIDALEAQLGRLVLVAPLVRVSSTGNGDQVQAAAANGSTPQRAFTAQRFQHAGFKSTPVVDASARGVIAFARNGIMNGAIVAEDDGYDPGLAAGEAVIYSPTKHACRIYFDNAGALHIDADPSTDVIVNGGSAKIGRVGDAVNAGSLAGTVLVAGAPVQVQFTYTPVSGSPVGPGPTAALSGGQITAGAPHFKG